MTVNWKGFKSGTDIRGYGCVYTDDPLYLSNDAVTRMTKGLAVRLREKTDKNELTVEDGHDSRV